MNVGTIKVYIPGTPWPWYRRVRGVRRLAHLIRPAPCPYCGERIRVRPRLHTAVWH